MTCPAFGSSSEVALYYAIDPDPTASTLANPAGGIVDANQPWKAVRITGESLDLNLSSTVSDEITPQRSYADSILTQGEVTGGFSASFTYNDMDDFLICALQSSKELTVEATPTDPWATTETIKNESAKHCLMFLKRVAVSGGFNYFLYRGCQIDGMSFSLEPGSIVEADISVMGSGGGVLDSIGTWVLNSAGTEPLMSAIDSLSSFVLTDAADSPIADVTFQSLSISISNQLRQQFAVGTGSIFAAGVASGRFQVTLDTTQYYANHKIYDAFVADAVLKLAFTLQDSAGNSYAFDMDKLKVQSGAVPLAGGPDQDLLISPTMQAFEDATIGTVSITKTDA